MSSRKDSERTGKPKSAFSRRGFIRGVGLGSGALGTGLLEQEAVAAPPPAKVVGPGPVAITLNINGKPASLKVEPRVTLCDALRNHLDMTGAKRVCDRGTCGACTVMMNGKTVYSCTVLAIDAQGKNIETIESLGGPEKMHPISAAFWNNDGQQCGYCTPGFVMACKGFLEEHPNPSPDDLKRGLGGNLCRCGTYMGVKAAVMEAAKAMPAGGKKMANTPDYSWPPMNTRKVMGTSPKRLDGPMKSTGRAKYSSDLNLKDMLHGVYLTSPHAHAKVISIDTSAAEKAEGVQSVYVITPAGTEVQWQGSEVAAVAALTEEQARDAVRLIKVNYEVMPHNVIEADLGRVQPAFTQKAGEVVKGDPDKAFTEAEVTSEGKYGIPVVTHCCLEPHGQVIQWQGSGDNSQIQVWPSTQNVTAYAGDLGQRLKVPVTNIKVKMDYIGGGFGSKFNPDAWAIVGANLSQKAGGRPVRLWLDRATEQMIAGNRPSLFAKVRVAGKKDGTITGWQGETWGSGGVMGLTMPTIVPYVFDIPNARKNHTQIRVNGGGNRAWRAPGNQQASFVTCVAIEDFAAKAGLDPMDVFAKNVPYAQQARQATYLLQLAKAAELSDWKKVWHPRGQSGAGPVKRGLGIGIATWAGAGHASQCQTIINPDGSVRVEMCTQDLGTGTRTIITQVVAETLGLPMSQIKLLVGSNDLPPDGSSGGSTTVGGVSTSSRRSSVNALAKLLDAVSPDLGVPADQLEARDGVIRVKGTPGKSMTWAAACKKLGTNSISERGVFTARGDAAGMTTAGVCGVQVADVSVDVETGVVKVNRYTAVQDCGLVINPRLAESQVHGAIIMGIGTALFEERIMDQQTGKMLNPDMEFYKLAGIMDVGDIRVHMDIREENDKRGVIGLGEPPAVPICGAISNAVANAIGMRVPNIPMAPDHVLNALEGRA